MLKRITRFTGLLVSIVSVVSIMPVYAADYQKLDAQDGTIYYAKVKGNGIFIDGEINGQDEAVYWLSEDGKYTKLNIDTGSTINDSLLSKYLEINTGSSDYTYLDMTNGFSEVDYDVREDLEATVARTLRSKIKHDNDGRFDKNIIDSADFKDYYNKLISTGSGLSSSQIPLKEKRLNGETVSTVYSDLKENYVDTDYNLGAVKIFVGSTTGASVTIKNTEDSYKLKVDGTDYDLKATIKENKEVTDIGDNIYRYADLAIYKKLSTEDDSKYSLVTASDGLGLKFGGKIDVDGTITVLQKFSKTQSTDNIDGIKYSKSSEIYFIADKDGNSEYLLGRTGDASEILSGISSDGSTKITGNDSELCSIYLDKTNKKIYVESLKLKTKDQFKYIDISDIDDSDIDSADSISTSGGYPWFINGGYIMTWDENNSFTKFMKIDGGMTNISFGGKNKLIVWNSDKDVYSAINIPKAATTTTGAAVTTTTTGAATTLSIIAQTGWSQNNDNTWSYLENGIKKTGWLKYDDYWYYLDVLGTMKTGWINDNGAWYYCDESGIMLSDTMIDEYELGSDGAWI